MYKSRHRTSSFWQTQCLDSLYNTSGLVIILFIQLHICLPVKYNQCHKYAFQNLMLFAKGRAKEQFKQKKVHDHCSKPRKQLSTYVSRVCFFLTHRPTSESSSISSIPIQNDTNGWIIKTIRVLQCICVYILDIHMIYSVI